MSTVATPTALHSHEATSASLDRKGATNGRRSTPDSEAVTSSDDEHESGVAMSLSLHSAKSMPAQKPMRRSSWLSDVHSSSQRKFSLGGGLPLAPVSGSQPPTPSTENGTLASAGQMGSGNLYSTRSGNGITATPSPSWERDASVTASGPWAVGAAPARPSTGHSSFNWSSPIWQQQKSSTRPSLPSPSASSTSTHMSSHLPQQSQSHAALPGQTVTQAGKQTNMSASAMSPGFNPIWGSSLTQEPPLTNQSIHSPTLSSQSEYQSPSSSTFEQSVGTAASSLPFDIPLEPNRKTMRSQSYSSGSSRGPIMRRPSRPSILSVMDSVSAEPEFEEEQIKEFAGLDASGNRTFKPSEGSDRSLDNEMAETALSAQSSAAFARSTLDAASQDHIRSQAPPSIFENRQDPNRLWNASLIGNIPEEEHETSPHDAVDPRFVIGNKPGAEFGQADQEDGYFKGSRQKLPQNFSPSYPQPNQSDLYLIVFKASRADIFFIADRNFGQEPKIGDMVIVEGDRGSDLGMVEFAKLTPQDAQQRKAEYNQKHYRQLVMFSRMFPHLAAQANNDAVFTEPAANLASSNLASPRGRRDSSEHRSFKVIKRIANESEIKLLRDKEGNEAKAKRIAQAKVNQHGINMEILDAEFQLDYKKLTFYFYAEQYVNFNELVTDLFKIWKLRIWLSAVNPNSFSQKANVIRRTGGNRHMEEGMRFPSANVQTSRPFFHGEPGANGGFESGFTPGMGRGHQAFEHAPGLGRGGVFAQQAGGMDATANFNRSQQYGQPFMGAPYGVGRAMGQQAFPPSQAFGYPGAQAPGMVQGFGAAMWQGSQPPAVSAPAGGPGRREPLNISFGALSPSEQMGGQPLGPNSSETTPTQATMHRRGPEGGTSPISALNAPNPIETLNARLSRLDVNASRQ